MKLSNTLVAQCSRCGTAKVITHNYKSLTKAVRSGWNSYGSVLYCPKCAKTWHERNDKELAGTDNTMNVFDMIYERQSAAINQN